MTVIFDRLSLHYFIMQEEIVTVPKKVYDQLVEKYNEVEDKEWLEKQVDNLEKIVRSNQEEEEKLNWQIQNLKNQLTEQNSLYNQIYELEQTLLNERRCSLQNQIHQNLQYEDQLFTESWLNRFRNLLAEININPNSI